MISSKAVVAGLVAVNVILGGALLARTGLSMFEKSAYAQIGGGPSLQIVGGQIRNNGTLFILNSANGKLAVVQVDTMKNQYVYLDTLDVKKDLDAIK